MNTFIITLLVVSIAILAMSVGAMFFNLNLKGSCGGKESCICSPEERKKCLYKITSP
jgi:hypothetical protein